MKLPRLLPLLSLCLSMLPCVRSQAAPVADNFGYTGLFAAENLVAWCIIPYDSVHRGPAERLAMLARLGFTQYAWDWRQEHLKDLDTELALAAKAGIRIRAVWLWIDERSDKPGQLNEPNRLVIEAVRKAGVPMEFWVGFNANFFEGLDQEACVKKGSAMISYLRDQVQPAGGSVLLYNHGDWFGEPDNQVKIIQAAGPQGLGIVYNFHHAHTQLDAYPQLLGRMLPYLRVVNLNGMRAEGPKILPLGTGNREQEMLRLLRDSGYRGALGLIGHTEGEDVELVLQRNLKGLRNIQASLQSAR